MMDVVLQPTKDGIAQVFLINRLGLAQKIEKEMAIGSAQAVEVIAMGEGDGFKSGGNRGSVGETNIIDESRDHMTLVKAINSKYDELEVDSRKKKLREFLICGTMSSEISTEECHRVGHF